MGTDGKPSVSQIAEASKAGALNGRNGTIDYEIIEFRKVQILIPRKKLLPLIETTAEFTSDIEVINLAETLGIKLRRFR